MTTRRQFIEKFFLATGFSLAFLKSDAIARISKTIDELPAAKKGMLLEDDEDFWTTIQNSFDVDRTIINLNNGGVSPSPRVVQQALKEYVNYSNMIPSYNMWRHLEPNIESIRTQLAKTFGVDREEIAITRNASESLENVQFGLQLNAGDEVITTNQDYPRMLTTWDQRARREGIVIKKISYELPLKSTEHLISKIEEAITSKSKVLHVSHVVFLTGQFIDVKKISRFARKYGLEIIVDGAHAFNHFPFKYADVECDYYGVSLHKWTYAPIGTGMLFVKKDKIKNVWPLMAAVPEMDDNIRKFEEIGTHPAANHNAIAQALFFNEKIGIERKAARLRYLHHQWIDKVRNNPNVKFLINVEDETQWAGLVTFNIENVDMIKLQSHLFDKHKIFTVYIEHPEFKGIRVSPNVFTRLSDMQYFAEVLQNVLSGNVQDVLR